MVYWSASEAERMPVVMDAVLQKYFPEKTWGAIPLINERGEVEALREYEASDMDEGIYEAGFYEIKELED